MHTPWYRNRRLMAFLSEAYLTLSQGAQCGPSSQGGTHDQNCVALTLHQNSFYLFKVHCWPVWDAI